MSSASVPSKTAEEPDQMKKKWIQAWKTAGPALKRIRREELRKVDTFKSLQSFLGPIDFRLEPFRPRPTSGLVQQQAFFKKLRR